MNSHILTNDDLCQLLRLIQSVFGRFLFFFLIFHSSSASRKKTLVWIYRHGDIHKADRTLRATIKTNGEGHHADKLHHLSWSVDLRRSIEFHLHVFLALSFNCTSMGEIRSVQSPPLRISMPDSCPMKSIKSLISSRRRRLNIQGRRISCANLASLTNDGQTSLKWKSSSNVDFVLKVKRREKTSNQRDVFSHADLIRRGENNLNIQ